MKLGVPVRVLEDQHRLILHHKVLWSGSDVDAAVGMVEEAQALNRDLRACCCARDGRPELIAHASWGRRSRRRAVSIRRWRMPRSRHFDTAKDADPMK